MSRLRRLAAAGPAGSLILASTTLLLYILASGRYGYFRDELYYLACSGHPALGYVDQPPLSIFILRLVRWLLGDSLLVLRLLNKYSIGFMLVGLAWGLALTRQRRWCRSPWLWAGALLALLLFLPHLMWEIRRGLPRAICGHNSYWYWAETDRNYRAAIVIGYSRSQEENLRDLESHFESVELAGSTQCPLCMPYENGRQVFLCRGPKFKLKDIWPDERFFI